MEQYEYMRGPQNDAGVKVNNYIIPCLKRINLQGNLRKVMVKTEGNAHNKNGIVLTEVVLLLYTDESYCKCTKFAPLLSYPETQFKCLLINW